MRYLFIATHIVVLALFSCKKDTTEWYTVTIGVYSKDSSENFIDTGKELVFNSFEDCQIWSRTALPDTHSSDAHLHYNAASNVYLDLGTSSFTWTEYGPELDESSIETTCMSGIDGMIKTVNDLDYYQDKPNVYLKIKSIIKN